MKNFLAVFVVFGSSLFASASTLDHSPSSVTPKVENRIRVRSYPVYSAYELCQKEGKGSRAATAREVALFMEENKFGKIRETEYQQVPTSDVLVKSEIEKMRAKGYWPIYTRDYIGGVELFVSFYYGLSSSEYSYVYPDNGPVYISDTIEIGSHLTYQFWDIMVGTGFLDATMYDHFILCVE